MSKRLLMVTLMGTALTLMLFSASRPGPALAQQASSATPPPLRVEIFQQTNVRAGPNTDYDQVGVLVAGQTSEVLGRSPDSTWIKIAFIGGPDGTGWVFRDLVNLVGELPSIPVIEPPPTPTLPPTPTAELFSTPDGDATQAAEPNYLPTFTPPAPVARPTLLPVQGTRQVASFPPAVLIIVLLVLGVFGGVVSVMRTR
jgi:uncharacterized protein YraI